MVEFELIRRYFSGADAAPEVLLGVGDDAATVQLPAGQRLVVCTDAFTEGVHFFPHAQPAAIGHKALAVNLSDMAAMGAQPLAFTLALGLPAADEEWLRGFSGGMLALADRFGCALVGGDTARAPVYMATVTVLGCLPAKAPAMLRSGAQAGDDIWVTGSSVAGLGDARLYLEARRGTVQLPDLVYRHSKARMERPEPRVRFGQLIRGVASAGLDISDGALVDLQHLLAAGSGAAGVALGAQIDAGAVLKGVFASDCTQTLWRSLPERQRLHWQLDAGDDYELLFTAAPDKIKQVQAVAQKTGLIARKLGVITASGSLWLRYDDGSVEPWERQQSEVFSHFG